MPVKIPATVIAIFILTCNINDAFTLHNGTLSGSFLPLPAPLPPPTPAPDTLPYPTPTPVPSYYPEASHVRQAALNDEASPSETSIIAVKLPSLRQGATSPAQGMISTLTSMVGGWVPYLRRPEAAAKPVEAPPTKKVAEEKLGHLDHEHTNEPAEALPDGVVAGGFFYEGQKANGEYFNDEMPESETLEVHSHDEASSPGKLHDDKSEHPYYVVDKPAEGPVPPPLVYFSSGLRSTDVSVDEPAEGSARPPLIYLTSGFRSDNEVSVDKPAESPAVPPPMYFTSLHRSDDATVAAWSQYYAKLRQYYDQYYPSFRRSGRAKDTRTNQEVQEFVENQMFNKIFDN